MEDTDDYYWKVPGFMAFLKRRTHQVILNWVARVQYKYEHEQEHSTRYGEEKKLKTSHINGTYKFEPTSHGAAG